MFDETLIQEENFRLSTPYTITDQSAHEPNLCVDVKGTVWVAWSEQRRNGDLIRVRSYHASNSGEILNCSEELGVEFQPTIAALPDGTILVAWIAYRAQAWRLILRQIDGGHVGDEQVLASYREGAFRPCLLVDRDGIAWLALEAIQQGQPRLMACHTADGRWSDIDQVPTPDAPCYRPSLSLGPDASVWIAYDVYRDGHYQVYIQQLDRISDPVLVTDNGYHNLQTALATDQEDNIWIAWASNQNDVYSDRWWLTKWIYLRRFDGGTFSDPVSAPPGKDIYGNDSFQGWEFPDISVDAAGRIWLFGQSSHTLYAQYYAGVDWSPLYTIAPRHWGSWKPRVRVAGFETLYLASMGLGGAQIQRLEVEPSASEPILVEPREPSSPISVSIANSRERPTITTATGEILQVFFGDLHAHSIYGDATDDVDEFYHRYRDGYGYDFACLTEHDYLDGVELSISELKMMWNHADRMTQPGQFVAFCGYEWTSPAIAEHAAPNQSVGEGHKHIIYPDNSGPLVSYGEETANTGAKLLKRLQGVDALVIPHHTGWSGTDWDAHDANLQRLVEVCSTHGRFEYAGNKPIGYRRDHVFPAKFVLNALDRGYNLGFVGGSDSHGLKWHATELEGRDSHVPAGTKVGWKRDAYRTGMTAILSPELTRAALYDALHNRRCYATSGVPIFVDFRINGALMGSQITVHASPSIKGVIEGTGAIHSVEVVRSGHIFSGLQCQEGEDITSLTFTFEDQIIIPGESHYYYLRVIQKDGNMAWSSPIWVYFAD